MKHLTEEQLRNLLENAFQEGMDYGCDYYDIMSEETPTLAAAKRREVANHIISEV